MKENIINNISDSKEKDKTKKNCLKEEFSKLKEFHGIEILDCIKSGTKKNIYHISIRPQNKKDGKDAIMKLLIDFDKSQLRKEVYSSDKLKNKNILNGYTHFLLNQGKSPVFIMEYTKYGNLRDFNEKILKRAYFSESLICYLACQILNGIKYMHISKVAHMDLKPENIVIDQYLNAKIVDFSVSLIYKTKKPEDYIKLPFVSSSFYMSKELLNSETIKVKDLHKIDLYSFGVTLYNLVFAEYPYGLEKEDENDYKIILEKIESNKLTFPNDLRCSSHFLDFMTKLLEKDIEKRMNIPEAMNHYWIKGERLLLDEKEKLNDDNEFLSNLLDDHIRDFNIYINQGK